MDQAAALPFRLLPGVANVNGDAIDILLVTSRDTGRWVLPKGFIETGECGARAAVREAIEEAGATGNIAARALGTYRYAKRAADGSASDLMVGVYPLQVHDLAKDWPERSKRERRWFPRREAALAVDEDELRSLLAGFAG